MITLTQAQIDAYTYYRTHGMSDASAAALVGVASEESGSGLGTGSQGNQNTDASGVLSNGQGAYGIFSWNGPRQQALSDYASQHGLDPADRDTQLAFAATEVQGYGAWSTLSDAGSSVADKISALVNGYTIPASQYRAGDISGASDIAAALTGQDVGTLTGGSIFDGPSINPIENFGSWVGNEIFGVPKDPNAVMNALTAPVQQAQSAVAGILEFIMSLIPRIGVGMVGLMLIIGAMYIFANQTVLNIPKA